MKLRPRVSAPVYAVPPRSASSARGPAPASPLAALPISPVYEPTWNGLLGFHLRHSVTPAVVQHAELTQHRHTSALNGNPDSPFDNPDLP